MQDQLHSTPQLLVAPRPTAPAAGAAGRPWGPQQSWLVLATLHMLLQSQPQQQHLQHRQGQLVGSQVQHISQQQQLLLLHPC